CVCRLGRLRTEPRQRRGLAHRLTPPSWLQQANAGHPWPACARPLRRRVFPRVESAASTSGTDLGLHRPRERGSRYVRGPPPSGISPATTFIELTRATEELVVEQGVRATTRWCCPATRLQLQTVHSPQGDAPRARKTQLPVRSRRTPYPMGLAQAAHGCAAVARWSRTRNRARRQARGVPRPHPKPAPSAALLRSEERRVGKECRSRSVNKQHNKT